MNHAYFDGHVTSEVEFKVAKNNKPFVRFDVGQSSGIFKTYITVYFRGEKNVERFRDLGISTGDRVRVDGPLGNLTQTTERGALRTVHLNAFFVYLMNKSRKSSKLDEPPPKYGRTESHPFEGV